MRLTPLSLLLLPAVTLPLAAQDVTTAEAAFDEGMAKIHYAAPEWREEFGEAMAAQATWRLGKNDPTRIEMTCGLATPEGCVPAGEYGLAMKKNSDGAWDLVVYSGSGHYDGERDGWMISPTKIELTDTVADALAIEFGDDHTLHVKFGPHVSVYPFTPVKVFEPVTTEFRGIPTTVQIMAVPIDVMADNVTVGTASVERGDVRIAWDINLTLGPKGAELAFENSRAAAIAGEKKQVDANLERVGAMLEDATGARKTRIEAFLAEQKEMQEKLAAEEQALTQFKPTYSVSGEVEKVDQADKTLSFESERVDGGMILKFGAGKQLGVFKVVPREFMQPRRR